MILFVNNDISMNNKLVLKRKFNGEIFSYYIYKICKIFLYTTVTYITWKYAEFHNDVYVTFFSFHSGQERQHFIVVELTLNLNTSKYEMNTIQFKNQHSIPWKNRIFSCLMYFSFERWLCKKEERFQRTFDVRGYTNIHR